MSLRLKLLAPLLLTALFLGSYLYLVWIPRSLEDAQAEHLGRVENHLDSVVEGLVPLLLSGQLDAIHENLAALKLKNRDWVEIRLVDAQARQLYPLLTQTETVGVHPAQREVMREIAFLNNPLGMLRVRIDFSGILAKDHAHHHELGLMLGAMALIFMIMLWVNLELIVRRPVHQLALASKELARRNFSVQLPHEKADEIGTLICSFSSMRSDLHQHHDNLLREIEERKRVEAELALHRDHLEELIVERTHELENKNASLGEALALVHRTQRELIESEKMASLGRLVAGFAHEINTPIGVAVGASSHSLEATKKLRPLLEEDEVDETLFMNLLGEVDEANRLVYSNLTRAAELVGSFKRTSVDQTRGTARLYNLNQTLCDIVASLHDRLKRTAVNVDIRCDGAVELYGYPGALGQVVTNLITNSLQHGFDSGTRAGHILIAACREGEEIVIDYRDTGKGISEENRRRIFEPFFTTARESGGTGLGLFICHNLATAELKGSLRCEPVTDPGACFVLRYPVGKLPQAGSEVALV